MKLGILAHVIIMTCAAHLIKLFYLFLAWGPALVVGYTIANTLSVALPLAGQIYLCYAITMLTHFCIRSAMKVVLANHSSRKRVKKNVAQHEPWKKREGRVARIPMKRKRSQEKNQFL